MRNKYIFTCFVYLLLTNFCIGQPVLDTQTLEDYVSRSKRKIQIFLDNLPYIADSNNPYQDRKAGIPPTLKIFATGAIIEEVNKHSGRKKVNSPKEYLERILKRTERAPIIIDFEIIDDVSPKKLRKKRNKDGSISYVGKMTFRQYYCKMKEQQEFLEPTSESPDINCSYADTTDKQVNFEIKVMENINGKFWITLISSIEVLRVF